MEESDRRDHPFPPEIVFEILARLPVKSLCRFRCVSTVWRSIISNPEFVSAHFAHSSSRPKLLISVFDTAKLLFSTEYPPLQLEHLQRIATFHDLISSTGPCISQSLGGMFCIKADGAVLVCNPSIRECVSITTPLIGCFTPYSTDVSFGFDAVEKKYKILHWAELRPDGGRFETEAHVLTLGENRWRRIPKIPAAILAPRSLCIDGVIYCIAYTKHREGSLLAFDVGSETVRMIPFPVELASHIVGCAMEFQGRPTLIDDRDILVERGSEIVLWTLEEFDNPVWSCKRLNLPRELREALINRGKLRSHGITHAGDFLWSPRHYTVGTSSTEPLHLYFYHLKDASMRMVEVRGLRQQIKARTSQYQLEVTVIDHVESLQSLKEFYIASYEGSNYSVGCPTFRFVRKLGSLDEKE